MAAKNIRNAIIALIMLGIGAWLLLRLGKVFAPKDTNLDFSYIFTSIDNIFNLLLILIAILIIILIPIWISKYRQEKQAQAKPV